MRALEAENSMMTMTTMADGLEAQDSSKSAFMEFGQQSHSQQSSPSMAGGHYPLHCLHSGSHTHHQHDSSPYSGTNSYNRSLPYPYVSHAHHSPYLPSYHNNTGGQTRLDGTGKPFSPAASCQSLALIYFSGGGGGVGPRCGSTLSMCRSRCHGQVPPRGPLPNSDRGSSKPCVNGTGSLQLLSVRLRVCLWSRSAPTPAPSPFPQNLF